MKKLDNYVKAIRDFPKAGVLFPDVTGILESPDGFQLVLDHATGRLADCEFDLLAARANALKGYDVVSLVKYPGK